MTLEELKVLNPKISISNVEDVSFNVYGRILTDLDLDDLIKYTESTVSIPEKGNQYVASVPEIENFAVIDDIKDIVYGQLDIEAGSCTGQNTSLTGVEYHQGSEVTIAVTDCVLIVGKLQDMHNNNYDSSKAKAFYLKKGQAIELYGTTLHYTPCKVDARGFMTIVLLIKGTNFPVTSNNKILTKKNKYFVTHASQDEKVKDGVHPGLQGELLEIKLK